MEVIADVLRSGIDAARQHERVGRASRTVADGDEILVIVIAVVEVFHPEREPAAEQHFGAAAGLPAQHHLVVVDLGEAVGGVGGGKAVVDPGIARAAGDIHQAAVARGVADPCAGRDRVVDPAGEAVARRRAAECGGRSGCIAFRTFEHDTHHDVAVAGIVAHADRIFGGITIAGARRRGLRIEGRAAVAETRAERIGARRGQHGIVKFAVAVGVEHDRVLAMIVVRGEAARHSDVRAIVITDVFIGERGRGEPGEDEGRQGGIIAKGHENVPFVKGSVLALTNRQTIQTHRPAKNDLLLLRCNTCRGRLGVRPWPPAALRRGLRTRLRPDR